MRSINDLIVYSLLAFTMLSISPILLKAQELYPVALPTGLWHNQIRELRYKPQGTDFVIRNGNRMFTRALYGTHTAFRVETGDRPEFALYMPGMGGNFKLGIALGNSSKWLTQANSITARYRAGSMLYSVEDSLLGKGKLLVEVLALADAEGMIIKTHLQGVQTPVRLYWAFGGATGKKFSRDGDMGPDPESSFYLKPENCKDNSYTLGPGTCKLYYGAGLQVAPDSRYFAEDGKEQSQTPKEQGLTGVFPPQSMLKIGDATALLSPYSFYQSAVAKAPALSGMLNPVGDTAYYFTLYNPATKPDFVYAHTPAVFAQAEESRKQLAARIQINTPDPFINTIGGTLAVASDATWEEPTYLHGSVGWRMRLNGWRGAYTADVLGWHDRAKTHLESYASSQVTEPANGPVVADTAMHLSRSWEKLGVGMFTSGYISRDPNGKSLRAHHYDMNIPYIDILLRHYAWTGDTAFLRKTWPVLKRHLEWETRNFDSDRDGLYDAYAAIWASDALQYSGGGVTHTSAYNYYAFSKAAEIARLLGEDPAPYREEAAKILRAMNNLLWMPQKGAYAEYKDRLGNGLLHPAPALWTIYHSMDSQTMNPFQAYQSLRYIDHEIPHIPVKATGLHDEGYYTLSTTSWMPYTWSLNNVALAESMHTALANWQGGRTDEAFKLFKSEILAAMYLGGSPGNFVQISYYDAIRGEAYRDFGDPVGMFSRALVEGLFGIVPDALNKTLTIRPGLPAGWNYASFSTPDIRFDFNRKGKTDTYTLTPTLPHPLHLRFQAIAQGQVKSIAVNGKPTNWKNLDSSVGKPVIQITVPASPKYVIIIHWNGTKPALPSREKTYTPGGVIQEKIPGAKVLEIYDPQQALTQGKTTRTGFNARVKAPEGNHTVFVQLKQGALTWWMPICFNIKQPVTIVTSPNKGSYNHSFGLQNNTDADVVASVAVQSFKTSLTIPAGKTAEIVVPGKDLVTGTNKIKIELQDGTTTTAQLFDWTANTKGRLDLVTMTSYFNDKVTQIFTNKYLSPRPQVTTLQLPWQGTGDWPHPLETHTISDSGLRKRAGEKNEFILPQGIKFSTPGTEGNNIVFTSQWDNYPRQVTVPLSGNASHAWFLMAGSTNPMQSQLDNGELVVAYMDGTADTLRLHNPETWWPIEKDYYTDGFAFSLRQPRPIRVHLKTGAIVSGDAAAQLYNGKEIDGGAATVLDLPLDDTKILKQVTLQTLANDVVIGLMAITLLRPS